jgi:hypothetical protein
MVSLNPLSAHLLDEEDMDLRFCYREHYKYSEFVILKGLKEEPKFVTIPRSGGLKEVEWHRIVSGLKLLEDGRNLLVQNYVRSSSLILRIERLLRLVWAGWVHIKEFAAGQRGTLSMVSWAKIL